MISTNAGWSATARTCDNKQHQLHAICDANPVEQAGQVRPHGRLAERKGLRDLLVSSAMKDELNDLGLLGSQRQVLHGVLPLVVSQREECGWIDWR